jgi:hypothetical protein
LLELRYWKTKDFITPDSYWDAQCELHYYLASAKARKASGIRNAPTEGGGKMLG